MTVYSVPITIYATAYVKADSEEAALANARELKNWSIEVDPQGLFCGLAFDNPALPDMSLSPAMTIADVEDDAFEVEDE